VDGKVVDVTKIVETGFRKTEFKGGAGTGGVYINDKFVYLKGFSERSSRRMGRRRRRLSRLDARLHRQMIRDCHANYMRWMHISPQKVDADPTTASASSRSAPPATRKRDVRAASGTSASK
jgi:beta-galactosidase